MLKQLLAWWKNRALKSVKTPPVRQRRAVMVDQLEQRRLFSASILTTPVQPLVKKHVAAVISTPATVTAVSVAWGTADTATLQTAADGLRLLPPGRTTDLPWRGINRISITLSAAETLSASDVSVTGIKVANYGPATITGSGTNYTITLAQPIDAPDRVTFTIGSSSISTYTRRLDVLPGDANDNGVINSQDAVLVARAITSAFNIFDDFNGNGVINLTDYTAIQARVGERLPSILV